MSQVELARTVTGLTAASISQFERGHTNPSAATLQKVSAALGVPVQFFQRRSHATAPVPDPYFRSLRSTSAADRRRSRALAGLVHEFVAEIENHVTLPDLDLPDLAGPSGVDEHAGFEMFETLAARARGHLGVLPGPVGNVVQHIERAGVVTARLRVGADKIDAFSVPYRDRPVVILGSDKGLRDRSRFDAAHELGHLLLHRPDQAGTRLAENQAHRFAAAFLLPRTEIEPLLPTRPDWRVLLELKQTWHVSLGALLHRAKSLGVMSEQTYVQALKVMSARGWRKNEPADLGPPESPLLLPAAVRATASQGVTVEELAQRAGLPLAEVLRLLEPSLDPRPRVVF
jgi:Zn-dependent peptidase ImmA (M78 family)